MKMVKLSLTLQRVTSFHLILQSSDITKLFQQESNINKITENDSESTKKEKLRLREEYLDRKSAYLELVNHWMEIDKENIPQDVIARNERALSKIPRYFPYCIRGDERGGIIPWTH